MTDFTANSFTDNYCFTKLFTNIFSAVQKRTYKELPKLKASACLASAKSLHFAILLNCRLVIIDEVDLALDLIKL
jgi:hypothetical protein